ncbi:ABC transporter ATP-binding protein [Pelagerythrobacter rhizovicinus]|uniref:ABC transporter ATP-binding protein n=1 Tax=Pelagerythrobacter rhizovicinus TaxID=2268576 RepID=A0A4V1QW60_9SPHN|nr:ABC transporter ATP-binding protein [Pelagerythrobacter rhizovicinus]
MPGATLSRVGKSFGAAVLFDGLDLSVGDGEFVVLVGPSGCGKSTLLRLIAGLERPDSGEICIGGRRVDQLPPGERSVAMVFQSYALYPQMTVAQNIAFPLRMAGRPRPQLDESVTRTCELLGLAELMNRRPAELSGGQRQRVAIGRAIVREPDLFLFDEPLSNLDAGLRAQMRREFAELHARLGTSTIYVTHDQAEAMALADRIVLMRDGRIEQEGAPEDLYCRPATLFAAEFFGQPPINRLPGRILRVSGSETEIAVGDCERIVLGALGTPLAAGSEVTVAIRPEALTVVPEGHMIALAPRRVGFVEWFGGERHARLGTGDAALVWRTAGDRAIKTGESIPLHVAPERLHLFDRDGKAIPCTPLPNL